MNSFDDYYKILNVDKNSDFEEIKKAYKKQIKIYHPDKNKDKNSTETFLKIQKAFETLTDEKKKKEYDLNLLDYEQKQKLSQRRKEMLNELERKEKEAKNKIYESNILNKKRFRYNSPLSQAYQYNNYSNNDDCIKIEFISDKKIEFSKSLVKAYFTEFGIIQNLIIDLKNKIAFIMIKSKLNIYDIIEKARKNNNINKLFKIEKFKWHNIDNKLKELHIKESKIKQKLSTEKIINELNYSNFTLDDFEKMLFK